MKKILILALMVTGLSSQAVTKEIVAKHSGKCVDVAGAGYSNHTNIQQFRCHRQKNQKFLLDRVKNDSYGRALFLIRSPYSGKCLDIRGGSYANYANVQLFRCHGGDNQLFRVEDVKGTCEVQIVNHKSQLCLDVERNSYYDGGNLIQYQCHGGDNQLFTLR